MEVVGGLAEGEAVEDDGGGDAAARGRPGVPVTEDIEEDGFVESRGEGADPPADGADVVACQCGDVEGGAAVGVDGAEEFEVGCGQLRGGGAVEEGLDLVAAFGAAEIGGPVGGVL